MEKDNPKSEEKKPRSITSDSMQYETKEGEKKPEPKKEPQDKMPPTETKE